MRKPSMSSAALALAAVALFIALGGTTWASGLIGGGQIKNGAITSKKIHKGAVQNVNLAKGAVESANLAGGAVQNANLTDGAVTTSKLGNQAVGTTQLAAGSVTASQLAAGSVTATSLAPNSVSSASVIDGSLTASDVASNTFLPANGTATDSNELGGNPPSAFIKGKGNVLLNRISVASGVSGQFLLDVGLGEVDGNCLAGAKPELSFTSEVNDPTFVEWGTTFPNTADINTSNALTIGTTFTEPNSTGLPQAVTFQIADNDGSANQMATVWMTGQDEAGTCVFTAQAVTSL